MALTSAHSERLTNARHCVILSKKMTVTSTERSPKYYAIFPDVLPRSRIINAIFSVLLMEIITRALKLVYYAVVSLASNKQKRTLIMLTVPLTKRLFLMNKRDLYPIVT